MKLSPLALGFVFSALVGVPALATTPACADLDLRSVTVGNSCLTRDGFAFTLITRDGAYEVWQDVATRALWSDRSEDFMTHAEALDWCQSSRSLPHRGGLEDRSWKTPSRADFDLAESHGFRQVLPHMRLRAVWTTDIYPVDSRFAYVFSGSLGTTTSVDLRDPKDARGHWHGHQAAAMGRCVGHDQGI